MKCSCAQKPELQHTGYAHPHPEWYCPICKTGYWVLDGKLETFPDDPQKWGAKTAEWYYDHHQYWWRK